MTKPWVIIIVFFSTKNWWTIYFDHFHDDYDDHLITRSFKRCDYYYLIPFQNVTLLTNQIIFVERSVVQSELSEWTINWNNFITVLNQNLSLELWLLTWYISWVSFTSSWLHFDRVIIFYDFTSSSSSLYCCCCCCKRLLYFTYENRQVLVEGS